METEDFNYGKVQQLFVEIPPFLSLSVAAAELFDGVSLVAPVKLRACRLPSLLPFHFQLLDLHHITAHIICSHNANNKMRAARFIALSSAQILHLC